MILTSAYRRATLGLLMGRLPGFFVPVVIARTLGASGTTDAFFLAFAVASFCVSLISTLAEHVNIPFVIEVELREGNAISYQKTVGGVLVLVSLGLVALGVVILAIVRPASGGGEKCAASWLLAYLVPFVALSCTSSILAAALASRRGYGIAMFSSCISSVILIGCIALTSNALSVHSLVLGYGLGELIRSASLWWVFRRIVGVRPARRGPEESFSIKPFLRSSAFNFMGSAALGAYPIVDRMMAMGLSVGSPSLLAYAERLWQVPVILLSGGFLSVSLVEWSRDYYGGHGAEGVSREMRRVSLWVILLSSLASAAVFPLRYWIASNVLGFGRAAPTEVATFGDTLGCLLPGLPCYAVGLVYTRGYLILKRSDWLALIAVAEVALKVVLNPLLMGRWGLAGLAASTSVMYFSSTLALAVIFGYIVPRGSVSQGSVESSVNCESKKR